MQPHETQEAPWQAQLANNGDSGSIPHVSERSTSTARYHRDLAIAALLLACHMPSPREWRIIRRSARRQTQPMRQAGQLLIERQAPSRECADPDWLFAFDSEESISALISGRLRGWLPVEFLEPVGAAGAAVVFGRLKVKGGRDARRTA